jgi:NAD(P)-dependent dehydrogenase (short-subunit alcohol dehydrogenase family)
MDERWTAAELPDLDGRTAVVTGATGGIGGVVARELARAGAQVVIAARDEARGAARAEQVRAAAPAAQVEVLHLDLASLASVRAFAERFSGAYEGADILINCAGVMAVPEQRTEDGFELQFGVNHLGHFALTGLLLPDMQDRPGARIVTVSSLNHQWGRIDWDDPQQTRGYKAWRGYNQSKLANLLFAFELDRRLRAAGAAAESLAAHPGYTDTGLQGRVGGPVAHGVLRVTNRLFGQEPDVGALPVLYAAAAPGVPGGSYIGPRRFGETRGHPALAKASAAARDPALAARLWTLSEESTGVTYPATAVWSPA